MPVCAAMSFNCRPSTDWSSNSRIRSTLPTTPTGADFNLRLRFIAIVSLKAKAWPELFGFWSVCNKVSHPLIHDQERSKPVEVVGVALALQVIVQVAHVCSFAD